MSPFAVKTALVTGARGFLGSEIVEQLQRSNIERVVQLGRNATRPPSNIDFQTLDLCDRDATLLWADKQPFFDFVFHAAGKIDHSRAVDLYARQIDLHVSATLNLLDALLQQGKIGRWIQIGSAMEYGNVPCPHSPQTRESPTAAYGFSKLVGSHLVLTRSLTEGFDAVVARPYLLYGNGQDKNSFLGAAINAAQAGKVFPTTGGDQTRDFVSVQKVASDLICLAEDKAVQHCIVNIGTGVEVSLKRVLKYLQTLHPTFQPQFGVLPYRLGEMMRSVGIVYRPVSEDQAWQDLIEYLANASA